MKDTGSDQCKKLIVVLAKSFSRDHDIKTFDACGEECSNPSNTKNKTCNFHYFGIYENDMMMISVSFLGSLNVEEKQLFSPVHAEVVGRHRIREPGRSIFCTTVSSIVIPRLAIQLPGCKCVCKSTFLIATTKPSTICT